MRGHHTSSGSKSGEAEAMPQAWGDL